MAKPIINLEFKSNEKIQVDNLILLLTKSDLSIKATEVFAANDAMRWLSQLQARMAQAINEPEVPPQLLAKELTTGEDKITKGKENGSSKAAAKSTTKS